MGRSLSWSRPFTTLSRSRPLLSRGMPDCRRATGLLRRVSFANTPTNVMGKLSRAKSSLLAESVMTWPAPGTRWTAHREGRQSNAKRFLAMHPHSIFQPSHAPALLHPVWGSEAAIMSDYNIGPDEIDVDALGNESFDASSEPPHPDRKSTRLNSSHVAISYAVFCLKKKRTAGEYGLRA